MPTEDLPLRPLTPLPAMSPQVEQELHALGQQYHLQTQHDLIAALDYPIEQFETRLSALHDHLHHAEQYAATDRGAVERVRADLADAEAQLIDWRRQRAVAQQAMEQLSRYSVTP